MKEYSKEYTIEMMSNVLEVSKSGYYKWKSRQPKVNKVKDELDEKIKKSFSKNLQTYGSPRIAMDIKATHGTEVSKTTIARRMQCLDLYARPKKKFVHTTDSDHEYKVAENLLNRKFDVPKINTVWVSDITYIWVRQYWMYLTTVIDLADRMVVGWSLSKDMTTQNTVSTAFKKAVENRGIKRNSKLIFHSDRGVQYASIEFREQLKRYGCVQSMSRKGNCWDNAVAESFFKTIKTESLNRYTFKNQMELESTVFKYINGFYNTVRIHTSLGGLSPLKASLKKSTRLTA